MCPPFCCLYVVVLGYVWEACIQYFPRSLVSLYLSDALHPCSLEAEVKSPNAGEQGHERQRFHAGSVLPCNQSVMSMTAM